MWIVAQLEHLSIPIGVMRVQAIVEDMRPVSDCVVIPARRHAQMSDETRTWRRCRRGRKPVPRKGNETYLLSSVSHNVLVHLDENPVSGYGKQDRKQDAQSDPWAGIRIPIKEVRYSSRVARHVCLAR